MIWARFTAWWKAQGLGRLDLSAQWRLLNRRLGEYGFVRSGTRWQGICWREWPAFVPEPIEYHLPKPAPVATREALSADHRSAVGEFLEERCEVGEELAASVDALYAAYVAWCAERQQTPINRIWLGRVLGTFPGVSRSRLPGKHGTRAFKGVSIRGQGPEVSQDLEGEASLNARMQMPDPADAIGVKPASRG